MVTNMRQTGLLDQHANNLGSYYDLQGSHQGWIFHKKKEQHNPLKLGGASCIQLATPKEALAQ